MRNRLTIAAIVFLALLTSHLLGAQDTGGKMAFDAASIKANKSGDQNGRMMFQPGGRFIAINYPVRSILATAYQLKPHQMVAGPEWDRLLSEHFDIETQADGNPSIEQMRLMMQSLLADRFKLVEHHETQQLPIYALVLLRTGRTGAQLQQHSDDAKCVDPTAGSPSSLPGRGEASPVYCGMFSITMKPRALQETGSRIPMDRLVALLSGYVDRAVVDRTGLTGFFDVTLEFAAQQGPGLQPDATEGTSDPGGPPSIFTAVQEQLGLKLEPATGPVDVLVIDHVQEPTPN